MSAPSLAEETLAALARLLAPYLRAELGAVAVAEGDEYTSLALPPYTTRQTFRRRCASGLVVGAVKEGHVWTCSREAWHAAVRQPKPAESKREANEEAIASVGGDSPRLATNDVDALLAGAGLRGSRTGARTG